MSAPKRAQEDAVKRSDEETQDEIEQIMSEIEQLQKEIGQADAGAMPAPAPRASNGARPKPALVKPAPSTDGPVIESGFTETDPLEEFRAGGSGEPSMEDAIGDLKGEEPASGGVLGSEGEPNAAFH